MNRLVEIYYFVSVLTVALLIAIVFHMHLQLEDKDRFLATAFQQRVISTQEGTFYLIPVMSYDQVQQMRKDNEFYSKRRKK